MITTIAKIFRTAGRQLYMHMISYLVQIAKNATILSKLVNAEIEN